MPRVHETLVGVQFVEVSLPRIKGCKGCMFHQELTCTMLDKLSEKLGERLLGNCARHGTIYKLKEELVGKGWGVPPKRKELC